jgi:hypothetical protein
MSNLPELNRAIEHERRLLADIEEKRSYHADRGETYQAIQAASEAKQLRNRLAQLIDERRAIAPSDGSDRAIGSGGSFFIRATS